MADNDSHEKNSPMKRKDNDSLSEQFVQFMGDSNEDADAVQDPLHPFEIFSLYDYSQYETHTYSNVQQIPRIL